MSLPSSNRQVKNYTVETTNDRGSSTAVETSQQQQHHTNGRDVEPKTVRSSINGASVTELNGTNVKHDKLLLAVGRHIERPFVYDVDESPGIAASLVLSLQVALNCFGGNLVVSVCTLIGCLCFDFLCKKI